MSYLHMLTAAMAVATLTLTAPVALSHEHEDHGAEHRSSASDAGGTPGNRGVGGSVDIPHAEGGAARTTPYDDVGTNDDQNGDGDGTDMQDITSGDQSFTDEDGRRSDGEGENR